MSPVCPLAYFSHDNPDPSHHHLLPKCSNLDECLLSLLVPHIPLSTLHPEYFKELDCIPLLLKNLQKLPVVLKIQAFHPSLQNPAQPAPCHLFSL